MDSNDYVGMSQVQRLSNYRSRAEELRRLAESMREDSARLMRSAAAGYDQMADTIYEVLHRSANASS